jgi:hypothetical protein
MRYERENPPKPPGMRDRAGARARGNYLNPGTIPVETFKKHAAGRAGHTHAIRGPGTVTVGGPVLSHTRMRSDTAYAGAPFNEAASRPSVGAPRALATQTLPHGNFRPSSDTAGGRARPARICTALFALTPPRPLLTAPGCEPYRGAPACMCRRAVARLTQGGSSQTPRIAPLGASFPAAKSERELARDRLPSFGKWGRPRRGGRPVLIVHISKRLLFRRHRRGWRAAAALGLGTRDLARRRKV